MVVMQQPTPPCTQKAYVVMWALIAMCFWGASVVDAIDAVKQRQTYVWLFIFGTMISAIRATRTAWREPWPDPVRPNSSTSDALG